MSTPVIFSQGLVDSLTKISLVDFFHAIQSQFYSTQDISFMDFFLELTERENEFCVHHDKLVEYGVMTSDRSNDVKLKLGQLGLLENVDYLLRDVSQQVESGTKHSKVYYLTPGAFKLCLMRAQRRASQPVDPVIYAKYYILLEKVFKLFTDYEKAYLSKLNSMKDDKIDSLEKKIDEEREEGSFRSDCHFSGSLPVMSYSVRLQRTRENKYYICVPALKVFDQTTSTRVCAIDPGVRDFIAIYDPQGFTISVNDGNEKIFNQCLEIDRIQSRLSKSKSKRERYRLRKLKYRMHQRIKAKVADMHQKCSKWLSDNYTEVLLPKFATSQMTSRQNRISCSASRSMLTWSHYKFKKMLEYKMQRSGGRVIECTEEYTSKACTCCGRINRKLTGQKVYKCSNCNMVLDRDLNGARNIFLKNEHLLQLDSRVQLRGSLPRGVSIC
jgi:IS605 OrfB family transposase